MPKQVDHDERRDLLARAVWRLAASEGLTGVSYREVAREAGLSLRLVQQEFATKQDLLVFSVDRNTARVGGRITERLACLAPDAAPAEVLRTIAVAFVPDDEESRSAMLVYHAFAAAALSDEALRDGAGFDNEAVLRAELARQLAAAGARGDPEVQARTLVSLVLGLSLGVLLGRTSVAEAEASIDGHLDLVLGR